MDYRVSPTPEELSDLLWNVSCDEDPGCSRHVALWLIAQAPEARALWQRVNEEPGDRPSVIELVRLVMAAAFPGMFPGAIPTAHWLLHRIEELREPWEQIRRRCQDLAPDTREVDALRAHRKLDDMLRAYENSAERFAIQEHLCSWPQAELQDLFNACVARQLRAEGFQKRLLTAVQSHLEGYLQRRREKEGWR